MRQNLEHSLELAFGHEGGYVNSPNDRGGPTKFGITHKTLAAHRGVTSVTAAQVMELELSEAASIYRTSYWGQSGGDVLPTGLDYAAFDFGVNSGPQTAVRKLQDVLREAGVYAGKSDGWIGEGTLSGVEKYPGGVNELIRDYCAKRMQYLRSLTNKKTGFPKNGRGWTIRVTGKDPTGEWRDQPGVVGHALAMANRTPQAARPATVPGAVAAEVSAKAEPKATNPWTTPEMLTTGATAATGAISAGGAALSGGVDPLRLAFALAILVGVGLAAYFIFLRIRKMQAQGVA